MSINDSFYELRRRMVETQLISRGIKDERVLEAFRKVPRELFVTENNTACAYSDSPLPVMLGQTISQPYIVALMTELLELPIGGGATRVLEIGTGSGYQSAILASMGNDVVSIEMVPALADFARANLDMLPYGKNVEIIVGDGCEGCPEKGPFDGILVTAASPVIPPALPEQLKSGGTLVIPCGDMFMQRMIQAKKLEDGTLEINEGIGCRFVPLTGKDGFK